MSSIDTPAEGTRADDAYVDHEYEGATPSRRLEIVFAFVAIAFTACFLLFATQIPLRREAVAGQMDARFWPTLLGVAGVALSILLLVIAVTRPAPTREDVERIQHRGVMRMVITLAITCTFIALWSLGAVVLFGYRIQVFPIAAGLLMASLMLVYGHRRWLSLIIYSVAVTAFVYVVFGMLLRIPL